MKNLTFISKRGALLLTVLLLCLAGASHLLAQPPRLTVNIVTPDSDQAVGVPTEDLGNGRWGLPDGRLGSASNPIAVQEDDGFRFLIGDRDQPGIPPGDFLLDGLLPKTRVISGPAISCFGCSGASPGMIVAGWEFWSPNVAMQVVATVTILEGDPSFDPAIHQITVELWFHRTQSATNTPPDASAGLDKAAAFGQTVTLSGSGTDPDNDPLTYQWVQLASTAAQVTLSGANTRNASFTAPSQTTTLEFRLTVSDDRGADDTDDVKVFVTEGGGGNPPPIGDTTTACPAEELADGNVPAVGTVTQGTIVVEGSPVLLLASGNDPDNTTVVLATNPPAVITGVFFDWEVVDGKGILTTAALATGSEGSTSTAQFTAPEVGADTTVVLAVTIADPKGCGTRITTNVKIQDVDGGGGSGNVAPTVQAGADRDVSKGEEITLPGSATDADGDVLALSWQQVSGPPIVLTSLTLPTTGFKVPLEADTGAVIVLRLTANDNNGGESSDDTSLKILANRAPLISVVESQLVNSGATALITATGTDEDDDPLSYSWTQLDGEGVDLTAADSSESSFPAPDVTQEQGLISLMFEVQVFDGLATARATHRVDVKFLILNRIFFPSSVSAFHPLFEGTFVGIAVLNPNTNTNEVNWTALGGDGSEVEQGGPQVLNPEGQKAALSDEIVSTEAVSNARLLMAQGTAGPIQGFFLLGGFDGTRLDGVGGGGVESDEVHLTIASHDSEQTTLYYVVNPSPDEAANVTVTLFDMDGNQLSEISNELPALGAAAGTLQQFFFPEDAAAEVDDGYVVVTADIPIRAFAVAATSQNYRSIGGQVPVQTKKLLVPHFFADGVDGDTVIRLLNTDPTAIVTVKIRAFDDDSNQVGDEGTFQVQPLQLASVSLKEVLNLNVDALLPGQIITGFAQLEMTASAVVFQKTPQVIGSLTFRGGGGAFRSTLPLVKEGKTETFFLHVAQSAEISFFTGLAIMNPNPSETATVIVEVYDETGELTGMKTVEVPPGSRVVDLLDGPDFFDLGFEQVGGHFRLLSTVEVVAIALFGSFDGTVMAAIEGQAPIQ